MDGLNRAFGEIMVIASGVVGLAIVAVLVSKNANTSNVLKAAGGALSNAIGAAVSPVTGGGYGNFAGSGFSTF